MPYDRINELKSLYDEWRNCKRCPLSKERTKLVFSSGPIDAEMMIIGEGPGGEEDAEGIPFVGKSGRLLNHLFKLAGVERDKLFVTNLVCCRPTAESEIGGRLQKKDRIPSKTEIEACWPRVERLIYIVDPVVIVAVGKTSALRLTGKKSQKEALKDLGTVTIHGNEHNVVYPVAAIYHPAYLLRQGNRADLFEAVVDQMRHLRLTLEAFRELGRNRFWKEKKKDG